MKDWKDKCDGCGKWKSCVGCRGLVLCAECAVSYSAPEPIIKVVKHKSDPVIEEAEQLALF